MVIGHEHAKSVTILRETDPGCCIGGAARVSVAMISCPSPAAAVIRHAWWYGSPGGEAVERGVGERQPGDEWPQPASTRNLPRPGSTTCQPYSDMMRN